ncbi:hypothetical protein CBER1_03444 [Cercospora berteroae]|uniref:Uncharacterized protein n=1 Tax=Cercospora berteroae TaxID=357750 RepID=A0A2S6CLT9_9PEZI|nr:hypothetical protein CBER1_03444 [Cercospora berteroae]
MSEKKDHVSSHVDEVDVSKTTTSELATAVHDATHGEHELSIREAIRQYKPALFWSLIMSTTVIMEGYDTNLLSHFFAYPSFLIRYVRHRMGVVESGIVSLHEFMALEEIPLDLLMFAAPPPDSGLLSRARGLNPEADDEWNVSDVPPLSQILPIGIERVSLVMHAGQGIEHGRSELSIVRRQLRTLKALFAADLKLSHPYLQQVILRHDGQAVDLGMHTIVGQSGRRTDVSLESQVARLLRGTGVVGVLIDDCHDAFESLPWEDGDGSRYDPSELTWDGTDRTTPQHGNGNMNR